MGNANILRGKKWTEERAKAVFENRSKDVEWMDSQPAIINDVQEYKNSLTVVKEEVKSKVKK